MFKVMDGTRWRLVGWCVLGSLGLGACETTHTTNFAAPHIAMVTKTEPIRGWALIVDGERQGWVVMFRNPEDESAEYYSVRNVYHQELGTLDHHGRAWRFVPHQREAEWLGTGTVLEGARRILEFGPEAELEEVPLSELRTP